MSEIDHLKKLLTSLMPTEMHDDAIDAMGGFTNMMVELMQANEELAPNYITISLVKGSVPYELTVRKCDGGTPSDVINALEQTISDLNQKIESCRCGK